MRASRPSGFTLIELMVAVAIVGILMAVAVPSYRAYTVRGNRAAAEEFLIELAQKESQFLADAREYKGSVADLNMTVPDAVAKQYTIAITLPGTTPPSFVATATPLATGTQASDGVLSIDSAGTKSPTGKW